MELFQQQRETDQVSSVQSESGKYDVAGWKDAGDGDEAGGEEQPAMQSRMVKLEKWKKQVSIIRFQGLKQSKNRIPAFLM